MDRAHARPHVSAQAATARPCDLFASATPSVAAINTTFALYRAYTDLLHQVTRQSDQAHADVGLLPTTPTPPRRRLWTLLQRCASRQWVKHAHSARSASTAFTRAARAAGIADAIIAAARITNADRPSANTPG